MSQEIKDFAVCVVVMLAVLWFAIGCSSVQQQLDPKLFYKRDVGIEVNGRQFEGVVVIPKASQYNLVLTPKGDIDLLLLRTCHREYTGEKLSPGWFGKNQFRYTYTPVAGLEDVGVCPMRVDMYESDAGRHSWALLDFESPDYELGATLTCNGTISHINGVGVCQAKQHTIQRLQFNVAVQFAPPKPAECDVPHKAKDGSYEWETSLGECLYHIRTAAGAMARLTVVGFEGVLVRNKQ